MIEETLSAVAGIAITKARGAKESEDIAYKRILQIFNKAPHHTGVGLYQRLNGIPAIPDYARRPAYFEEHRESLVVFFKYIHSDLTKTLLKDKLNKHPEIHQFLL
jgi:hypothetical protein